jgi:hypothetical protein
MPGRAAANWGIYATIHTRTPNAIQIALAPGVKCIKYDRFRTRQRRSRSSYAGIEMRRNQNTCADRMRNASKESTGSPSLFIPV